MAKLEINKEKLIDLYNLNWSLSAIAKELNCSRETVTRRLEEYGLKTGNRFKEKTPKIDLLTNKKQQIKELYLEGKSCNEIGKILNLTGRTVNYHLKQMNVDRRPTKKIDQIVFEQLWNEGKTDEEIATYFGVEVVTIKSFRTKGDNAGKFNQIRYFSQTEQHLSYIQEQFILGSLLGDLNLSKPRKRHPNSRLSIVQCEQQKDLFLSKVELLGEFMGNYKLVVPKPDMRTKKIYKSYRGNSKAHEIFTELYNLLYTNEVKTITNNFLDKINHPIALAYWFMDDGSNYGTIATNSFSEQEVDLLIKWMDEKWKIKCTKQKNRVNHVIYISNSSRLDFEELIFPYVIPSMYYKLKFLNVLQTQSV